MAFPKHLVSSFRIMTPSDHFVPTLRRAILTASIGFSGVSLCVFATVTFAERWMFQHLGVLGAYLAWTILFIVLGGAVLGSLVPAPLRFSKFFMLYGLAFLLYAVGWVGSYLALHGAAGEWAGSLAGSILMSLVFAMGFKRTHSTLTFSLLLFVANSLGYFLGSGLYGSIGGKSGMLLFGVVYGLFLGAGIGAVLHLVQVNEQLPDPG